MLLDILAITYLTSVMTVWGLTFATLFSKRVVNFVGISNWDEFIISLVIGIIPILNIAIFIGVIIEALPKLPTPKTWK